MRGVTKAELAEKEAIARRNKPVDAEAIEKVCERLAELSDRNGMREISRDITFRFARLDDCLAVRAWLEYRWPRDDGSTATQAIYRVEGMTVTLFCPELKHCRDHVARGIGTLRPDRDFTVLLD